MENTKLVGYLRTSREVAELTQSEVAKTLGYGSSQFISNWERGLAVPPMNSLRTLAKLYKINMDELFEQVSEASLEHIEKTMKKQYLMLKKKLR